MILELIYLYVCVKTWQFAMPAMLCCHVAILIFRLYLSLQAVHLTSSYTSDFSVQSCRENTRGMLIIQYNTVLASWNWTCSFSCGPLCLSWFDLAETVTQERQCCSFLTRRPEMDLRQWHGQQWRPGHSVTLVCVSLRSQHRTVTGQFPWQKSHLHFCKSCVNSELFQLTILTPYFPHLGVRVRVTIHHGFCGRETQIGGWHFRWKFKTFKVSK